MNAIKPVPAAPAPKVWMLWLVLAVGLTALGFGGWNLVQSLRCRSWPVTTGVITAAEMTTQSGDQGGESHGVKITYDYAVAGQPHTGSRIAFGELSSSSGGYAGEMLARYPVGAKVSVHYSPADSAQAVLEPGIHFGTWICFGVGSMFALFPLIFLSRSGRIAVPGTDRPPVLGGVLFMLLGALPVAGSWNEPDLFHHVGGLLAGGFFILAGLFLVLLSLKNPLAGRLLAALEKRGGRRRG